MIGITKNDYRWYVDFENEVCINVYGEEIWLNKDDLLNMLEGIVENETKEIPKQ